MLRTILLTILAVWGWLDAWRRGWEWLDARVLHSEHGLWWVWYGVGVVGVGWVFEALWFAPRRRRS